MKNIISAGFTLVEMLVAIALASIVISVLLGAFITFIQYQSVSQDERDALESVRFMLSDISRDLHFGYDYTCASAPSAENCTCLAFTDQIGRRIKIRRNSDRVEKRVKLLDTKPNACDDSDSWSPLTDDSVKIEKLLFEVVARDTEQPRVRVLTNASYEIDGEEYKIALKTQVTRRVLEPSQDIATGLSVGERTSTALSGLIYYIYTRKGSEYICSDENGREYSPNAGGETPCDRTTQPIAAEMTDEALYVLGDNGLIFAIPINAITGGGALSATGGGGGATEKNIRSSVVQGSIIRVIGKSGSSGCRGCDNDPSDIIALYPTKRVLYAKSSNGALYTIQKDRSIFTARRILRGGVSTSSLKHIAVAPHRVLVLFRDDGGKRVLRLYTESNEESALTSADMAAGGTYCSEFRGVPDSDSDSCRQISPDPIPATSPDRNDPTNAISISPTDLSSIETSSISRLQVVENNTTDNTLIVWYRSGGLAKAISIVDSRAHIGGGDPAVEGKEVAKSSAGALTSICQGGNALCSLSSIQPLTYSGGSVALDSAIRVSDHRWFPYSAGAPFGYTNDGRLVYFAQDVSSAHIGTAYDSTSGGVFCDMLVKNKQQVVFSYLSEKHPDQDLLALIGSSIEGGEQESINEIYFIEESSNSTENSDVCGLSEGHIQRIELQTGLGGPALDIIRLTGLEFKDKRP